MSLPTQEDFSQKLFENLTERQLQKISSGGKVDRMFTRTQIEQAFLETFDLVGGVPRLAIWANDPKNYDLFLQLLTKLFPKGIPEKGGKVLNYRSNIPQSSLNSQAEEAEIVEDGQ